MDLGWAQESKHRRKILFFLSVNILEWNIAMQHGTNAKLAFAHNHGNYLVKYIKQNSASRMLSTS